MSNKRQRYNLKDFFRELSEHANYISEETAREVYYGLISYIGSELLKSGKLACPDLGEFVLHKMAPRRTLNVHTKKLEYLGERSIVKFKTGRKMKAFFLQKGKEQHGDR